MHSSACDAPIPWHGRDFVVATVLGLWSLLIFALVWNPWWMPSGDAEAFIVTARNLLHGRGYTFNGAPVAMFPPGWPIVLAGLLTLTDQYLWLKAVQILCLIVFLLLSYATLRRFVPPQTAGLACGLAAVLWPLYPLSIWLHSDALFCALAGILGLLCVYWGDGRIRRWWIAVILVGMALAVFVRWAALPHAILLGSLLLGSGRDSAAGTRSWPWLAPRHALGAVAIVAIALASFLLIRAALMARAASEASPAAQATSASASALPLARLQLPEELLAPDLLVKPEDPQVPHAAELARRALNIPRWFSWTLFAPMRIADPVRIGPIPAGRVFDFLVGLLAMAMLAVAAWRALRPASDRRPHVLWLGVFLFVVAIALNWPHINNRYLVPAAPMLIAGILVGLGHLAHLKLVRALRWAFVASVIAVNGALWCVDVAICRSTSARQFYTRWEAGIYLSLLEIGHYLRQQPDISDGAIVASTRYQNLNERWEYPLCLRAVVLMTDEQVRQVPQSMTGAGVRKAQAWARETGVRYYVQQNPTSPGRVWHFRVTPELEERISGPQLERARPQFELYIMRAEPRGDPSLKSLGYQPVPLLADEQLERLSRRVPSSR